MKRDLRTDPRLRELAVMAEIFVSRANDRYEFEVSVEDLHDCGRALLGDHTDSTDLAELAANYQDTPQHRKELVRSAREVLRIPVHPMSRVVRIGIGCYLAALAAVVLAITPWAWSLATSSVGHTTASRARFLRWSFMPSPEFNLIIIVMLMSVLGSLAVLIITFANRAGQETLERGFLWWYLTRPFAATAVGVLFYMAIIAGFFNQTSATGRSALVLAAAIGGLAGLFTDNVLQKMRGALLGLSSFNEPAKRDADTERSGS